MPRGGSAALVLACLGALTAACFGTVLFRDHQFAYRDAAEYHEPLAQVVRQEWAAGRWPLWDPSVNGGTPLLGNPAAAVLYPGKLVELLPPPWGGRLYAVGHVWLAFLTMRVLLRGGCGVSREGSNLGGLAYAFGAPVLFQYSNVLYLVGAAWAPLGLWAVDRLVRLRRRRGLGELALILALVVLGGDPETAYLIGVAGVAYAIGLGWLGADNAAPSRRRWHWPGSRWGRGAVIAGGALLWCLATIGAAHWVRGQRAWFPIQADGVYPRWYEILVSMAWVALAVLLWRLRGIRQRSQETVGSIGWLAGAAVLAVGLASVQIVPAWELGRRSVRVSEGSAHDANAFSLEPYRAAEWVWPGVFGSFRRVERQWLALLPPRHVVQTWVPSLYMGGLTLLLAWAGALGSASRSPVRAGLIVLGVTSFLGALGIFGSPVWWARQATASAGFVGTPGDGGVGDGAGGVYWLLGAVLPGFQAFRYPSKLLTFTCIAVSGLAALGWDRAHEGRAGRVARRLFTGSAALFVLVVLFRGPIVSWLQRTGGPIPTVFGPFDAPGSWRDLAGGIGQGTLVMALGWALMRAVEQGRRGMGTAALVVLALDLGLANANLIVTAPKALFEEPPAVARLIEQAERRDPSAGPFRVHRMPTWFPAAGFGHEADPLRALTQWEYDTIKPRSATRAGLAYTLAGGGLELADYNAFLGGMYLPIDTTRAPLRGASDGQAVLYYTRRGYDLWGTRYFVVPMNPGTWQDPARGIAAFLTDHDLIAPDPNLMESPANASTIDEFVNHQDWMLLRNRAAYPRAWVVHRARFEPPIETGDEASRRRLMEQILYPEADPIWRQPGRRAEDPHRVAWIETNDPKRLARFSPGPLTELDARESVRVSRYEPQVVELEVELRRPGFVVLADVNDPGWSLAIDDRPAPIFAANRLMRGAAVDAGRHRLRYEYHPLSFRIGGVLSLVSVGVAAWLWFRLRPRSPSRSRSSGSDPREVARTAPAQP